MASWAARGLQPMEPCQWWAAEQRKWTVLRACAARVLRDGHFEHLYVTQGVEEGRGCSCIGGSVRYSFSLSRYKLEMKRCQPTLPTSWWPQMVPCMRPL